jgi:hypothetical protein
VVHLLWNARLKKLLAEAELDGLTPAEYAEHSTINQPALP